MFDGQGAMLEFVVRSIKERTNIFREGTRGETAYILKEGSVVIYTTTPSGERYQLAELTAPTILGEMALLSKDQVRTASAEAATQVELIEINKVQFDSMMAQSSSIIGLTMQALARRLVDTTSRLKRGANA